MGTTIRDYLISHTRALEIIGKHGWTADAQTETIDGEWVRKGSSFHQMLGMRHCYKRSDVMRWLGY